MLCGFAIFTWSDESTVTYTRRYNSAGARVLPHPRRPSSSERERFYNSLLGHLLVDKYYRITNGQQEDAVCFRERAAEKYDQD